MSGLASQSLIVPDRHDLGYRKHRLPGESIHASSDFFRKYSGYTEHAPGGTAVWSRSRAGLSCKYASQSGGHVAVAVKALPSGPPLTIETLWFSALTFSSNPGLGICFTDGTVNGSNITGFGELSNFGANYFNGTLASGGANSFSVNVERLSSRQGFIYARLIWVSSNTFAAAYSVDGEQWSDFGQSTISDTHTPTHMGFWVTTWSQTGPFLASFSYLRVYEADLSV